jgi:hypothetical protein
MVEPMRWGRRRAAKASEDCGGSGLGLEKEEEQDESAGISRIYMSPDDHFVTGFEGTLVTDYMTISNGRCGNTRY